MEKMMENKLRTLYLLCGIAAALAACLGVFDIVFGRTTNLADIPQSATARFEEFEQNWALGLYHLDLLNAVVSLLLLIVSYGLFSVHKNDCPAFAGFAFVVAVVGTIIFVTNNAALPMYGLSVKYLNAPDEVQKMVYASAGEALLAQGEHGGLGAFTGYFISALASLGFSLVMLKGAVFKKAVAYIGIVGYSLMLVYLVLVTFVPSVKSTAVMLAAPGGLLTLVWLIIVALRFMKMGKRSSLHTL